MQFLVDTGSIDQATKQRLMGTTDYVPFYRVIEDEQYTEGLFGQVKKASQFAQNTTSAFDNPDARIKEVLRKLKGGEERIGDLYENIFANTQAIVSAGMRNVAAQRTVKMIEELKRTDTTRTLALMSLSLAVSRRPRPRTTTITSHCARTARQSMMSALTAN